MSLLLLTALLVVVGLGMVALAFWLIDVDGAGVTVISLLAGGGSGMAASAVATLIARTFFGVGS